MRLQAWSILLSSISCGVGLVTLSLVIRNELRERRMRGPILWAFHRYGTLTYHRNGPVLETSELVQYGRQPTRVYSYYPVGFEVKSEEGHRLRSHIKAEDTLPLLLDNVDRDNAWILISHFPRDDRRWLYFDWVELRPTSDAFDARVKAALEAPDEDTGWWKNLWIRATRWVPHNRATIRPVGPTGHRTARIRADRGNTDRMAQQVAEIYSLAETEGGGGMIPAY